MNENNFKIKKMPPVWLVTFLTFFRSCLTRLSKRLMPANVVILEMAQSFYISKAIGVAASLNIADQLLSGPKTANELASATNTNPEALFRMLRTLSNQGIFKYTKNGKYCNSRLSKSFLTMEGSMKYMVMHLVQSNNWKMIGEMDHVVNTGESAEHKVLGKRIFEHLSEDTEANEMYNRAMSNASNQIHSIILSVLSFKNSSQLVDLGGGQGWLLGSILLKNKNLKGILFDLPHVVQGSNKVVEKLGLEQRMSIYPGDFFDKIPQADSYLMKNIIHAFNDNDCIKLLKNIYKASTSKCRIYIIEPVIDSYNGAVFGTMFDLQLLIGTTGGRERTSDEYKKILTESGFRLNRIISTISPFSIVEAIKES